MHLQLLQTRFTSPVLLRQARNDVQTGFHPFAHAGAGVGLGQKPSVKASAGPVARIAAENAMAITLPCDFFMLSSLRTLKCKHAFGKWSNAPDTSRRLSR